MFDFKNASLEDLEKFASNFERGANMTTLYTQDWIPNATTAEEAELYAKGVAAIMRNLEITQESWEVIFTEAYKAGKSVEAFDKLVEFGLLNYPV